MMRAGLRATLRSVGPRKIVVVTDRYPPHAHGGAEVSLHIALSALENKGDFLVVAFGDRTLLPRRYEIDGVSVLLLARQAQGALHRLPHAATLALQRLPSRVRPAANAALQRAAALRTASSRGDPDVTYEAIRAAKPRGGPVADFLEYPSGLAVTQLRELLLVCAPEIVHADNYRSIVTVAHASAGMQLSRVGVVRDNRFHCVRHDQSVRVNGVSCSSCDFACASQDLPANPALQLTALRRSAAFRRSALHSMDRIVVTSGYLRSAIEALDFDGQRIVQIANTPDDTGMVREAMLGVAELPGTNVLVVGMLNENKGQLELVRRLDVLTHRVPDVVLHFAGRGDRLEQQMKDFASKRGLSERLVFHGYVGRERLYELYRQCQLAALPTIWPEPFGRVPLEAALARRPVVSFAVGGLKESILHGETGYLVDPGDFSAFVEAIGRIADDPARARRMGARAYAHVPARFGIDEMTTKLTSLWASLTHARPRRGVSSDGRVDEASHD